MQIKVLMFLVVLSLGLGGFATWKHFEKGPEELAKTVMQGIESLRTKEVAEQKKRQSNLLKEKAKELSSEKDVPMAGNPEGDVSIVYFFDYACGYCRKADPIIDELVKTDPGLKVIYKEFPIFSDTFIARAALIAHKQGKYLAMHKELMANEREFTKNTVFAIAKKVGLNMSEFEKDMNDKSFDMAIHQNHQMGEAVGVEGTPVFVVGESTLLPGVISVDEFRLVIQKEREKLAGAAQQKEPPHSDPHHKS
jgi:protein-disulfide isomerase